MFFKNITRNITRIFTKDNLIKVLAIFIFNNSALELFCDGEYSLKKTTY